MSGTRYDEIVRIIFAYKVMTCLLLLTNDPSALRFILCRLWSLPYPSKKKKNHACEIIGKLLGFITPFISQKFFFFFDKDKKSSYILILKFLRNLYSLRKFQTFTLIIFQKDMSGITMELRDTNGGIINWNETLYKDQARLLVSIFGTRNHAGLQIFLRRTNGDRVPPTDFIETVRQVNENSIVIDVRVIDVLSSRNKHFPLFNVCLMLGTEEVKSYEFRIKSKKTESIKDKTPVKQNIISNVMELLKGLVNQDNCTLCTKKNGDHNEGCSLATTTREFEVYFKSKPSKKKRATDVNDAGKSKKMKTLLPFHAMNWPQTTSVTNVQNVPLFPMNSSTNVHTRDILFDYHDVLFGDSQCSNPNLSEDNHGQLQRHESLSDVTTEASF